MDRPRHLRRATQATQLQCLHIQHLAGAICLTCWMEASFGPKLWLGLGLHSYTSRNFIQFPLLSRSFVRNILFLFPTSIHDSHPLSAAFRPSCSPCSSHGQRWAARHAWSTAGGVARSCADGGFWKEWFENHLLSAKRHLAEVEHE